MKNKKIFFRVLALVGVAVLMFALAVPCFADVPEDVPDGALDAFYDEWQLPLENMPFDLREIYGNAIFDYNSVLCSVLTDELLHLDPISLLPLTADVIVYIPTVGVLSGTNVSFDTWYDGGGSEELFVDFEVDSHQIRTIFERDFTNTNSYACRLQTFRVDDSTLDSLLYDDIVIFLGVKNPYIISDEFIVLIGGTFDDVQHPARFLRDYIANGGGGGDIPTEPTRSGMFDELYVILRDAIYGKDVVLDGAQDFSLTLVTTLLVFATVLLPVLLVIAIMFKLFR